MLQVQMLKTMNMELCGLVVFCQSSTLSYYPNPFLLALGRDECTYDSLVEDVC